MGDTEIDGFLEFLSIERHVAANTQKVALNALVFLYEKFLDVRIGKLKFQYAQKRRPTVFSHDEAKGVIGQLKGVHWPQYHLCTAVVSASRKARD